MLYIPFYNHYFKKGFFSDESTATEALNGLFTPQGIKILEFPCLCCPTTPSLIDAPFAFLHGSREDERCYEKIEQKLILNPQTTFYIWNMNFALPQTAMAFFGENPSVTNCRLMNSENLVKRILEIKELAKRIE